MDKQEQATNYAKRLLVHYMSSHARAAGLQWDSDNTVEVEEIVDAIIKASAYAGAKQALRALPASVQE